jgi:ssDNA-binding Zn-finger/Zn-ribbon topoisomerase 1
MAIQIPESMEELVYWTSRKVGDGYIKAWAYRGDCPECKKAKMGKPREKGKVKIRAKIFVCPECDYKVDKEEYEETLNVQIMYTCSKCKHKGETQIPFKRKRVQLLNPETGKKKAAEALIFFCESCNEKLLITKKMKS